MTERDVNIRLKVVSFDIEVVPLNVNQMPTPDTCPVILISNHFNYIYETKEGKTKNIVFVLTKNYEGVEVQENKIVYYMVDEKKLLMREFDIIRSNDIIIGYNTNGFDLPYIFGYSEMNKRVKGRWDYLGGRSVNIGNGNKSIYCTARISKGMRVVKVGGITGKITFDVLYLMRREDESNIFRKSYNLKIQTLRHISKEILGIEKLDFPIEDMVKYWENTDNVELRNKFVNYCSRDSEIPLLLFTKHRLLDKFTSLAKVSGRLLQEVIDTTGSGMMVENRLLKEFKKEDRLMPYKPRFDYGDSGDSETYERELGGAEVFNPVLGVSENICSVDYKSLYPSLMVKHNLCYSTLITEKDIDKLGLTENDIETQYDEFGNEYAKFVKKEKYVGIVPRTLMELLGNRAAQKKEMKKYQKGTPEYMLWDATQQGTKILLNSFYGYSGDSKAKVYSWLVATAVTTNGRIQIKKTWKMITEEIGKVKIGGDGREFREFKLAVTQGDTDSSYMQVVPLDSGIVTKDEAVKVVNYVLDKVNSTLEKPMQLDFENYIKRIIITAKKRYAMLIVDDNGKEVITSKGIETIRREWSNFASNNMAKVIEFILKEKTVKEGVDKSIELVKEQAKLLIEGKIDIHDLVMSKKLTKQTVYYGNKQIHVEVATKMKQRGHPSQIGDRITFIILDNGMKLISDKAEEAELVIANQDKYKVDYNYYLHSQLLPPLIGSATRNGVLELLGVHEEELLSKLDSKQKSLFDY